MDAPPGASPSALRRAALASRAAASIVIAIALTVLAGWALDLSPWARLGLGPMKANTAVGFLLAGLALWRWHLRPGRLGVALALGTALVGGATLVEYLARVDLGIDQLLFPDVVQRSYPGRMAPATASMLLLLGLALASLRARAAWLPHGLALAAAIPALLAIAGYLFGVESLRRIGPFVSTAGHTAVAAALVALGTCAARTDGGVTEVVVADDAGGHLARRLLPAAVAVPLLIGWVRVQGQHLGYYDTWFGVALVVLSSIVTLSALVWWNARALSRLERERRRADAARAEEEARRAAAEARLDEQRRDEERARALLEARLAEAERDLFFTVSLDLLGVANLRGFFERVNPAFSQALGWTGEELTSRPFLDLVHPDDVERTRAEVDRLATGQLTIGFENRYRCKDGSYRWITWTCSPDRESGLLYAAGRDLTRQKEAEASLLQSEERWRSAFELAAVGMGLTSTEGRWLQVNQALCRIVGRTPEELLALTFQEITHADDLAGDAEAIGRLLSGELATYHNDKRYFHKQGHVVWIHLSVSVVREGGAVRFLALVQDITARKRAEAELRGSLAEKEVLLREIHHRVKNNLQIVTSLLNLQLRVVEDETARGLLRESQDRVKTMALVHETLYRSKGLATLDAPAYLRDLVASLFRSYGAAPRLSHRIEAQDVRLEIDAAVPLGLIVNELVSNALKHAFPDGRSGRVEVTLSAEGDSTTLTVTDDGVGLPPGLEARRQSIGLQLVDGLASQLRGTLATTTGPGGTTFTLVFPQGPERADEPRGSHAA